jgi:hypothetical protein
MENERRCKHCGAIVESGFCIRDGEEYYCSPDCLETVYTETEYVELYKAGEAYWTEWED